MNSGMWIRKEDQNLKYNLTCGDSCLFHLLKSPCLKWIQAGIQVISERDSTGLSFRGHSLGLLTGAIGSAFYNSDASLPPPPPSISLSVAMSPGNLLLWMAEATLGPTGHHGRPRIFLSHSFRCRRPTCRRAQPNGATN